MSQTPLSTYLNDHLAGSIAALELMEHLAEQHAGTKLERFFRELHVEIEGDQRVLEQVIATIGARESPLKHVAAWVTEKAARIKLLIAGSSHRELGLFEGIETLCLGVLGKRELWLALSKVAGAIEGLHGHDFEALARRAEDQHDRLELQRLAVARAALLGR